MEPPHSATVRTHACPGGCGREVELHRYACVHCWVRLPAVLRSRIRESYLRRDWDTHTEATAAADEWLRTHPFDPGDADAFVPAQLSAAGPGPDQYTLFDVDAPGREVPASHQLRVQHQLDALRAGQHPLSVTLDRPLPLHPDAAPAGDRRAAGLRCGSCVHRQYQRRGDYDWPKCLLPGASRVTRAPGTDVRAWWPACTDHATEPSDQDRAAP